MKDPVTIQQTHDRQIGNIVQIGVIAQADFARGEARVRIGDLLTGWLPMLSPRARGDRCWWPHEVGEQVYVFAPSGHLANGAILGAAFCTAHPANGARADVHPCGLRQRRLH